MKEVVDMVKKQTELVKGLSDKFDAKLNEIETRLTALETINSKRSVHVPGLEDEKQKFSFAKAIYGIVTNDWSKSGFEKEVFDAVRTKLVDSGTSGAGGGYIIPPVYIAELIEMLRANITTVALGATMMTGLTGSPVEIPRQVGGATAYWLTNEDTAITESGVTFNQLVLSPKQVAGLVRISNRLLMLSNPAIEDLVRRDLAQVLALAIDLAALRGTGTNGQPKGIANTTGINTVTSGGKFTFDVAQDMVYKLEEDNALRGNLGYVMHPAALTRLKKQKVAQFTGDTSGMPLVLPMTDQNLKDLLGYDFKTTTQIPIDLGANNNQTEVYFGNWQELVIAQWGGLEITASADASDAFLKNQTFVRAVMDVDIGVRHAESFCLCNDVIIS